MGVMVLGAGGCRISEHQPQNKEQQHDPEMHRPEGNQWRFGVGSIDAMVANAARHHGSDDLVGW